MSGERARVTIVGAGLAGLTCARRLRAHDVPVTLIDKGRRPGGRIATRRHGDQAHFDHGAQYFTVRDERFRNWVAEWKRNGAVAEWTGRIVELTNGDVSERAASDPTQRFVGVPGMSSVARQLSNGLDVRTETRITSLSHTSSGWSLRDETGSVHTAAHLVLALPAPQTFDLLAAAGETLAESVAAVTMTPCWAVMAEFDARLPLDFDGAFVRESPLSWIARNNSKPGRPSRETWVLHASADWTRMHLEEPPEIVAELLVDAMTLAVGRTLSEPAATTAHRWRYAIAAQPLEVACLSDRGLTICGDWCRGNRVEGAFLSGWAAADNVLRQPPTGN